MNAPPPGAPDAMKLSRMIRLVTDYVQEGLIPRPERPFTQMTEGELDSLIEAARAKRTANEEPAEAEPAEEPVEEAAESIEEQAAKEIKENAVPVSQPGPQQPEPQQEGSTVSEEGGISDDDFREKFPIGERIDYNGQEHVVISHSKPGAEGITHLHAIGIESEPTEFSKDEYDEGDYEVHKGKPTKLPAKTEYPPQVFLLARVVEGMAVAEIFLDHKKLAAEHPDIDGDTIMEAISDPGEPQGVDGGTLTYADIG